MILKASGHENDNGEVEKNRIIISMALDQGLLLIHHLIASCPSEKAPASHASKMEILERMDIARQIVKMVELILVGNKFFQSSQLYFALKIDIDRFSLACHQIDSVNISMEINRIPTLRTVILLRTQKCTNISVRDSLPWMLW